MQYSRCGFVSPVEEFHPLITSFVLQGHILKLATWHFSHAFKSGPFSSNSAIIGARHKNNGCICMQVTIGIFFAFQITIALTCWFTPTSIDIRRMIAFLQFCRIHKPLELLQIITGSVYISIYRSNHFWLSQKTPRYPLIRKLICHATLIKSFHFITSRPLYASI